MDNLKRKWGQVPSTIRRPVVFIIGSLFIIAAAATGWLPGPGGIPLFLIGVAILATEFEKAERFRNRILSIIHALGKQFRKHRVLGTLLLIAGLGCALLIGYFVYKRLH